MLPNNNILVGNQEFSVFLCANVHERNNMIFVLDMLVCFTIKKICCLSLRKYWLLKINDRDIFYGERITIYSVIFFVPFLKDKAPEVQPTAEEDISQEDWLSIKASLAQANDREELERIKEDRVEYQEVQCSD